MIITDSGITFYKNLSNLDFDSGQIVYHPESSVWDLQICDVDKDNLQDIIYLGSIPPNLEGVYFLKNNGNLTFTNFPVKLDITSSSHINHGDLNSDGYEDIIINISEQVLDIYNYAGNGTFTQNAELTGGSYNNMFGVIVFDYDNDGRNDLVFGCQSSSFKYSKNLGNSTFQDPVFIREDVDQGYSITPCKINDDDNPDFFINKIASAVDLVPGGNSMPYDSVLTVPLRPYTHTMDLTDMDKDGYDDMVLLSRNGGIFIYYRSPQGITNDFVRYFAAKWVESGVIADYNSDGYPDFVFYNHSNNNGINEIMIMENQGNREFSMAKPFRVTGFTRFIDVEDIDHDGIKEIIAPMIFYDKNIYIFKSNLWAYDEYYVHQSVVIVPMSYTFITDIDYDDINSDGWTDILVAYGDNNAFGYLINNKQGGFDPENIITTSNYITGIGAGDLNNDSIAEILVGLRNNQSQYLVSAYTRTDSQHDYNIDTTIMMNVNEPSAFIVRDFDNNGYPDFMVSYNNDYGDLKIITQNDKGFNISNFAIPSHQRSLVIKDINSDGLPDLVTDNWYDGTATQYLNNSVFAPTQLTAGINVENAVPETAKIQIKNIGSTGAILIAREDSPVSRMPEDGIFYTTNYNFGIGSHFGGGNYAVYAGSDSTFNLHGLNEGIEYYFSLFEYNTNEPQNTIINYLTTSSATDSVFIKNSQTLSYADLTDHSLDEGSFTLNITASSGLPVENEVINGPITLNGSTVEIIGIGDVMIHSSQAGNDEYFPEDSTFTFSILKVTGIEDSRTGSISIHPNPFIRNLTIELPPEREFRIIRLYNLMGNLIFNRPIARNENLIQLQLPQLKPGLYILEFNGNTIYRSRVLRLY